MNYFYTFVEGIPKAQPRPSVAVRGKFAHVYYKGKEFKIWKETLIDQLEKMGPFFEGPIGVRLQYLLKRPKALKKPTGPIIHVKKPDVDNLDKIILDALTQASMLDDDSQVSKLDVEKWYTGRGMKTGIFIAVRTLTDEELVFDPMFDYPLEINE